VESSRCGVFGRTCIEASRAEEVASRPRASAGKMCERASEVEDKDEKMKGIPPSATASARCFCRLLLRCCFARWRGVWSSTPESQERFSSLTFSHSFSLSLFLALSSSLPLSLFLCASLCSTAAFAPISFPRSAAAAATSSLKVLQGQFSLYLYSGLLHPLDTIETLHLSHTHTRTQHTFLSLFPSFSSSVTNAA